jgi:beta-1,4-mannosyl-glycoprotein beta-1,4-N-acetylglucosaminyltransferase
VIIASCDATPNTTKGRRIHPKHRKDVTILLQHVFFSPGKKMLAYTRVRRFTRIALAFTILLALTAILNIIHHDQNRAHTLNVPSLTPYTPQGPIDQNLLPKDLSPLEKLSLCTANGFHPYTPKEPGPPRKVYDLILLSTELDWLEIRLHTLAPWVDYFVIVESPTTFTGHAKPLYLRDNWARFEPFAAKIIHRVVEDGSPSRMIWDHEEWLRNSLLYSVFPGLIGTEAEARENDVLVVSDVDEVVRPETMFVLRNCLFPTRLTLLSDFYYYSFQWRHRGPQWAHPEATLYRGAATLAPETLRMGKLEASLWSPLAHLKRWRDRATLANAGWHCSSCFATVAEMQTKMHSFSHQELDTPENSNARAIVGRVRTGQDLFGRAGEVYDKLGRGQMDVPGYILEQNEKEGRFKHLLMRDGEDAGFEDWEAAMREGGG